MVGSTLVMSQIGFGFAAHQTAKPSPSREFALFVLRHSVLQVWWALDMLIEENRISVGVSKHQACRTGISFNRLGSEGHTFSFEVLPNFPNVGEVVKLFRLAIPPRVEGEHVPIKHPLEQTDRRIPVTDD